MALAYLPDHKRQQTPGVRLPAQCSSAMLYPQAGSAGPKERDARHNQQTYNTAPGTKV